MDKKTNLNLICNIVWQNNVPNIKWISVSREREKTSGKLIIRDIVLSPKAITSWKINGSNSNLICYLGMPKQCTKYQMNIWKQREKKSLENYSWFFFTSRGHNFVKNQWIKEKLNLNLYLSICEFFQSLRAIASWKINGSEPNSNLIWILEWQSNVPNLKWISGNREIKDRKTVKSLKEHNSSKN
jgi:hypothetical protein